MFFCILGDFVVKIGGGSVEPNINLQLHLRAKIFRIYESNKYFRFFTIVFVIVSFFIFKKFNSACNLVFHIFPFSRVSIPWHLTLKREQRSCVRKRLP
jgi:hypothetical protein